MIESRIIKIEKKIKEFKVLIGGRLHAGIDEEAEFDGAIWLKLDNFSILFYDLAEVDKEKIEKEKKYNADIIVESEIIPVLSDKSIFKISYYHICEYGKDEFLNELKKFVDHPELKKINPDDVFFMIKLYPNKIIFEIEIEN